VRLHGPALNYGVNSRELGSGRRDEIGFNQGLFELPGGDEVRRYFHEVMRERLLPSGRVRYLPSHDFKDGVATSLSEGSSVRLNARKKAVDATYAGTQLPTTHPPSFTIAEGVRCIAPHSLSPDTLTGSYAVIGAGKTAMDTVVWLLNQGVGPERIAWVRPRDAWILPRETIQPSYEFFTETVGAFAAEFEAAQASKSMDDLFLRLEANDLLRRIDANVMPSMYRCAIASAREMALLRQVTDVIRLGRVTALEPARIVLDHGARDMPADATYINCSADGIPRKPAQPIFQGDRILLQYARRCSPTFSAALIAHIEAMPADDAAKNALVTPVPAPDEPLDWLRMHLADAHNRQRWSQSPALQAWLVNARLDRFTAMIMRALTSGNGEHAALVQRYGAAMGPGLRRMGELLNAA
jgi:hypothetical protein